MGKASRWMRNLLMSKKDEKPKKKDGCSFFEDHLTIPTAIIPNSTPKQKRRWSFKKSSIPQDTNTSHKITRSFDSIVTSQLITGALLFNYETEQNHLALVAPTLNEATKTTVMSSATISYVAGPVEEAAAIKIQAFFRSYLARRALYALKGLVKLQALVRGHLVRKQTKAMLRSIHALMSIQVRARVNRIHRAEEAQLVLKRTTAREPTQENHFTRAYSETMDSNTNQTRGSLKSNINHINHRQTERNENGLHTYYSGPLSMSKQEHHQICPSPSASSDMSSRPLDSQFEKLSNDIAKKKSQFYSAASKSSYSSSPFVIPLSENDPISNDYRSLRNYMTNTEASRAKARSQSEPKQRPKWSKKQKTKRTVSMERMNSTESIQIQHTNLNLRYAHKNQYPWLIKLYRSAKFNKDSE